jgi:hypothetical protein
LSNPQKLPVESIKNPGIALDKVLSCPYPISIEPPQLRAEFCEAGNGKQPRRRKSPVKKYARAEILRRRDQWIRVATAFQGISSRREPKARANRLVLKLDVNETVLSS